MSLVYKIVKRDKPLFFNTSLDNAGKPANTADVPIKYFKKARLF
jgi:hypothetical protein